MMKTTISDLTERINSEYDVTQFAIERITALMMQFDKVTDGQCFNLEYQRSLTQNYDLSHWDITELQYFNFHSSGLMDLTLSFLQGLSDLCEQAIDDKHEKDNISQLVFNIAVADKRIRLEMRLNN